jgi:hypothetical protein
MSAPDAVDGSYSGIAMYQVAVVNQERQMSLLDSKCELRIFRFGSKWPCQSVLAASCGLHTESDLGRPLKLVADPGLLILSSQAEGRMGNPGLKIPSAPVAERKL